MAEQAIAELGNAFGLVNIAGVSMPKSILDMTREKWAHTSNQSIYTTEFSVRGIKNDRSQTPE